MAGKAYFYPERLLIGVFSMALACVPSRCVVDATWLTLNPHGRCHHGGMNGTFCSRVLPRSTPFLGGTRIYPSLPCMGGSKVSYSLQRKASIPSPSSSQDANTMPATVGTQVPISYPTVHLLMTSLLSGMGGLTGEGTGGRAGVVAEPVATERGRAHAGLDPNSASRTQRTRLPENSRPCSLASSSIFRPFPGTWALRVSAAEVCPPHPRLEALTSS